jgi:hypothetical protein
MARTALPPPLDPLQPVIHANRCGLAAQVSSAIVLRQGCDLCRFNATNRCGALRRPLQGVVTQSVPAQGVLRQVVVVQPVVADQFMHQRQRQRGIGAGQQGNMFVAFVGRFCAARVDANELGAVALGQLGITPEMQVAANRIAAPDQNELGMRKLLDPHADLAAQGVRQPGTASSGANGAVQQRGPQRVEKPRGHAVSLHQPHGACVAVGQDGLRCIFATARNGA